MVETLVAITILTLAIAGPLLASERVIRASLAARDRLTASYLAQEGVEYAQAMRNQTTLTDNEAGIYGDGVNGVFDDPSSGFRVGTLSSNITSCLGAVCALDPGSPMGTGGDKALRLCSGNVCPALNLSSGAYTLGAGTPTLFTRNLRFYDVGLAVEVQVSITWSEHGTINSATSTSYLSPWQ